MTQIKHNCYYCRYNDIEQISKEYAIEKVELEEALAALAEVENRKNELLEEKRLEEVKFHHPLNYLNCIARLNHSCMLPRFKCSLINFTVVF